jgi:hypothetical protein
VTHHDPCILAGVKPHASAADDRGGCQEDRRVGLPVLDAIIRALVQAGVAHFDETGFRRRASFLCRGIARSPMLLR